ncbi:MAG: phosphatase PAP2 family protein [Oscillospiraceae bacterium]|nr:phosphatase PAP2 family protein [Oscillospiraceae bacterium]
MELTAPALWINQTFSGFDVAVTTAVHKLYEWGGAFFTPFFEGVSYLGKGGIFLIVLSLILMVNRPTRRFGTAMCFGLAIGAIITNLILKPWVARPRPYADEASIFYQFWLLVGQNLESDKSFPSGHTTAAFDSMMPVFLLGKRRHRIIAVCFAVLMGIARIYLCVHFPSDVLAGMLVGIFAGCIGTLIAKRLKRKWYTWDLREKLPQKQPQQAQVPQQRGKHEIVK